MAEQTAAPDKAAEKNGAAEETVKHPMFSKTGLIILLMALLVEGVIATVMSGSLSKGSDASEPVKKREIGISRLERDYIRIDGPTVAVPRGVGGHEMCRISQIHIVVDSELSEKDRETLENNIINMENKIKQSLAGYLKQQGYENLMLVNTMRLIEKKLRDDLLRLAGVTEREIREVELDDPRF